MKPKNKVFASLLLVGSGVFVTIFGVCVAKYYSNEVPGWAYYLTMIIVGAVLIPAYANFMKAFRKAE